MLTITVSHQTFSGQNKHLSGKLNLSGQFINGSFIEFVKECPINPYHKHWCVCAHVCVCAWVCAHVSVCVHVHVCICMCNTIVNYK